ncbi:MAG: DNA-directed RNA polymerase subunit beta' [Pelagibacterales bacterium MED-G41]|nr:MAG: DNA-directed RNA polymerase subunit beta' [Pelagibacterales bacterium MED-G41]
MKKNLTDLFKNSEISEAQNFNSIKISLASPEKIKSWTYGEIKKPETINYRTFRPEKDGLFCARIFGPIKDYECLCGKYKRMKFRGIICEKCGVEVTKSNVRRERMGHINLATPVAHIWFLKSLPSRIALAVDMKLKEVERVLYFENFIVVEPGLTGLKKNQLLNEEELAKYQDEFGEEAFTAGIGAEAVLEMLKNLDLDLERKNLVSYIKETKSKVNEERAIKRLKLIESFIETGQKPEWMIMTVVPVIPPELRPLVPLDGGRFATSDLNDLYRRVINRNNRLKRLMDLKAPDIIVRNEKRMLQESVDALFDNGRRGRVITGTGKRPLKSLAEMLKGKQGRFRQNLLGKRVDYSGRSVIVVGPDLKLHECGLPKKMALELFKPFLYARLNKLGLASTIKQAKKIVEKETNAVWDALELIVREHPVLLNRAPTLHRLGVQAFEPKLIEGDAIELHPLTCAAFNADFDGDQMAVHVPLSLEAQLEARILMLSTNNILSPSNGKPIIVPSQDMILGIYYLSQEPMTDKSVGYFTDADQIEFALSSGQIKVHSTIISRFETIDEKGNKKFEKYTSTAGRFLLANLLPKNKDIKFSLVDRLLPKKVVSEVIDIVFRFCGQKTTVIFCDKLKDLGFKHAFKAGISFGKDDLVIPDSKTQLIDDTKKLIADYETQYAEGLITRGEKYNKVVDAWSKCTDKVAGEMMKGISATEKTSEGLKINSVFMMADSGARGSAAQMKQLAGMRGLIAKPSGEIIESPITSNFKEGLTALEYFNSTHGARKGLADTALKTASSGYLTRRLCDVAQDLTITKKECDCKNPGFIELSEILEGGNVVVSLSERALGRITFDDVKNPITGDIVIKKSAMIDEAGCDLIDAAGVKSIKVYSVMTCGSKEGVCATSYGRDLSRGKMVHVGEAIGMISAQSIGEPGTQLTMRTFHVGGTASVKQDSQIVTKNNGILKIINSNILEDSKKNLIVMGRNTQLSIEDENGVQIAIYKVAYGSKVFFKNGDKVKANTKICEWDPYTTPVIAEKSGIASFVDLIDGVSIQETTDDATGISSKSVIDWRSQSKSTDLKPRITLRDDKGNVIKKADDNEARYYLVPDSILSVKDGQKVSAGDVIARLPKETTKTKDITGGLPRVAELFEARKAKDSAIIAENDGQVIFGKEVRGKQRVSIAPEDGSEPSNYLIPKGKHINFNQGERIKKGEYLLDGQPLPHDILRILGIKELTEYFVNQVQEVYRLQGVIINDKHIETILRQMLKKVEVKNSGDSTYLPGEIVDKIKFENTNEKLKSEGKLEAKGERVLMGITKASLQTESFISAASFQETTRVLTDAAIKGKVDPLNGLKENVIVGRLVPAGTGNIKNKWNKKALEDDNKFLSEQEKIEASETQVNQ